MGLGGGGGNVKTVSPVFDYFVLSSRWRRFKITAGQV